MAHSNKIRINWIDQLKGFGIILVVYGHNLPFFESYIYTFHMPLFFFIAGLFHPKEINIYIVKKRAKQILLPYLFWSFLLFLFWLFIGRKFGDSVTLNYSALNHFIGIFYAQGGHPYMSWGVPLWFLPSIFFTFIFFGLVKKIKSIKLQVLSLILLISIGFIVPRLFNTHIIWSLDVSLVSLFFYAFAFYLKSYILQNTRLKSEIFLIIFSFLGHLICSLFFIVKVDMYRSIYTNELFFLLNASFAICFWLLIFKRIRQIKLLTFFGKNTIPILALHIRMITVIKLFLLIFLGTKIFSFNEFEKVILVIIQLSLLYPIIRLTNKYVPILNGKITAKTRN